MINMAVISLKDIIKYLVKITIIIAIVVGLTRYFLSIKNNVENPNNSGEVSKATSESSGKESGSEVTTEKSNGEATTGEDNNGSNKTEEANESNKNNLNSWQNFLSCLDISIPAMAQVNSKENNSAPKENKTIEDILSVNLGVIDNLKSSSDSKQMAEKNVNNENGTDNEGNNEGDENKDNDSNSLENIEHAETGLKTEVLESNVSPRYSQEYYGVKIRNETDYKLTNEVLDPTSLEINTNNIIIYQTHSCESYTASEKYQYKQTGNFRTTDKNFSVIRVGRELTNQLKSYGYNVIHDENYHDYPSYTGSYTSSLNTATKLLEENKDTDIVIDVHRDAVGDNTYAPTVKIGDEYAAQIMFVVGGNGSSIPHPEWQQNLKFAIKVQQKANELYPGLFRPIILRESGYNQQVSKAASLIEVGATGNTLDQCLVSMKYLAKVLDEVLGN